MNYGENFINIYNKEFIKIKLEFLKYLEGNFTADETFPGIFDGFLNKLYDLQKTYYNQDSFLMESWEDFWFRYSKYNNNAAKNIIDKIILEKFNKNISSNSRSKIKDYPVFLELLAHLSIYKDFERLIRDNYDKIEEGFKKKKVEDFLKVKKQKNEEYLVHYFIPKKNNKILENIKIDDFKGKTNDAVKNTYPMNPFDDDQKFIIINALLHCLRSEDFKISNIEVLLILKITSSSLINSPIEKSVATDYKKITQGINFSKKDNRTKRNQLTVLREMCLKLNLTEISRFFQIEMNKL